jgi:hypothetical protein
MTKFKFMPKLGWFIVGLAVAVLLIPSTVAGARSVLKYTGIEGTSGNQADVTAAGQVLTAGAQPSNLLGGSVSGSGGFIATTSGGENVVFTAPSNSAIIMEEISLNIHEWSSAAGTTTYIFLFVGTDSCADGVGGWYSTVSPTGFGPSQLTLTPGVAVPAGDELCAYAISGSGEYATDLTATGSVVPAASVTELPAHALPASGPPNA